jgi:hypothetical protein
MKTPKFNRGDKVWVVDPGYLTGISSQKVRPFMTEGTIGSTRFFQDGSISYWVSCVCMNSNFLEEHIFSNPESAAKRLRDLNDQYDESVLKHSFYSPTEEFLRKKYVIPKPKELFKAHKWWNPFTW